MAVMAIKELKFLATDLRFRALPGNFMSSNATTKAYGTICYTKWITFHLKFFAQKVSLGCPSNALLIQITEVQRPFINCAQADGVFISSEPQNRAEKISHAYLIEGRINYL